MKWTIIFLSISKLCHLTAMLARKREWLNIVRLNWVMCCLTWKSHILSRKIRPFHRKRLFFWSLLFMYAIESASKWETWTNHFLAALSHTLRLFSSTWWLIYETIAIFKCKADLSDLQENILLLLVVLCVNEYIRFARNFKHFKSQ